MTAPVPPVNLDQLETALAEPERTCQWCMARPGEWCESDCGSPYRRCHPTYVAQYAADNGAASDEDAALIVTGLGALPALIAELRDLRAKQDAVRALAEELSSGLRKLRAAS